MARPKNFFATVRFSVNDVLALRTEWTEQQAREFLTANENAIEAAMSEAGANALEELLAAVAD